MKSIGGCVAALVVAAGLLAAAPAGAMTTAGPGAVVNTPGARETVVNGVIARIDVKQGVLVAGGRGVLGRAAGAGERRARVAEAGQQGELANDPAGRHGAPAADHRARLMNCP